MTHRRLTTLILTGLTTLASQALYPQPPASPIPASLRPEIAKTFRSVNPQSIRATMSFLADDLVEGRQPGTRGFAIASRYIQTEFMALGLLPGVHGSYVQPVPLKKGVTIPDASTITIDGSDGQQTLVCNTDFLVSPNLVNPASEVSAPLVFAGFGVYAPELKYDDYGNTDVKGKIVVAQPLG